MSAYAEPIKIGLIIFPIIALLITLPYMIRQYHKFGSIPFMKTFIVYSFVLYLLIAWFMVILPLPKIEVVEKMTSPWANLVPFAGLNDIIQGTNFNLFDLSTYLATLKSPAVYTVLFNFLLTLPFGVYLRYYFNRKWWEVLSLTFLLSLFFEVTQLSCLFGIYPRPYRLFDVDDLIVNTMGGFLGFLITPLVSKILPSRESLDEKAYINGQKVSYPRRFIASLIDFVIVSILVFSGIFKNDLLDLSILSLILLLYYVISVSIFGRTIGKLIVGIKVVNEDEKKARFSQVLIRYFFKYCLFFEVFYVTILFEQGSRSIWTDVITIMIYIMLVIVYFKSFINAITKKKPIFYESLSHTKNISTIKNRKSK